MAAGNSPLGSGTPSGSSESRGGRLAVRLLPCHFSLIAVISKQREVQCSRKCSAAGLQAGVRSNISLAVVCCERSTSAQRDHKRKRPPRSAVVHPAASAGLAILTLMLIVERSGSFPTAGVSGPPSSRKGQDYKRPTTAVVDHIWSIKIEMIELKCGSC